MNKLVLHQLYSGIVEGYSSDGQGIVKPDGAVIFVPGAVRGEEIELRVTKIMANAAAGEITRVLNPSPRRREPDCACFGQCGGCQYRHISYREELQAKYQRVRDALRRIGGCDVEIENFPELSRQNAHDFPELSCQNLTESVRHSPAESPEPVRPGRYRNKAIFPVDANGQIGFYRARSHEVIPVRDCLLLSENAVRTAQAVRDWMFRYQISGYDEKTGKGLIRYIFTRCSQNGEMLCCLTANGKKLPHEAELSGMIRNAVPQTIGILLNINSRRNNVILSEKFRTIWGSPILTDSLCGLEFQLSVPSFYQVNRIQTEYLYNKALEYAALTGQETVLDLYCGIGTVTLCMARHARRAYGAEIVPQAVRDAEANARRNHMENVSFLCADASETAQKFCNDALRPDVVTVDPPRKGLTPEGIAAITAMAPARVVYISCDPATLARDIRRFAESGYYADRAAVADLFPGTCHVETVVSLSRK